MKRLHVLAALPLFAALLLLGACGATSSPAAATTAPVLATPAAAVPDATAATVVAPAP